VFGLPDSLAFAMTFRLSTGPGFFSRNELPRIVWSAAYAKPALNTNRDPRANFRLFRMKTPPLGDRLVANRLVSGNPRTENLSRDSLRAPQKKGRPCPQYAGARSTAIASA